MRALDWKDYELIDCGNFEKLERFGQYILIRPEPQALWDRKLQPSKWQQLAHAHYIAKSSTSGEWEKLKPMSTPWSIHWNERGILLNFLLKFTGFKHIGIFPEQAANWVYLYDFLRKSEIDKPKVLNLFAYTGGASLVAKAVGADIIHLDSVKQVVGWARENMEKSNLKDIRWVVEDAVKFVERENRRGNTYHAIIMDPPSYGLGPSGERWKLEDQLNEMMRATLNLLEKQCCFIINTYSLNLSSLILRNLIRSIKPEVKSIDCGELYVQSSHGDELPLGSYARFHKT